MAAYDYRWSEGHEVAFSMIVAGADGDYLRGGQVVISARQSGDQIVFSVIEPEDSAWDDCENFGRVLSRAEALDPNGLYPDLWSLVDTIVDHEPRLADRIKALHGA